MKTKAGLFLSTLLMLVGLGLGSSAYAKNEKVDICHLTSSATNPVVMINVSSKAAQAHIAHGDSLASGGSCGGEPESVQLQACSSLDPLPIRYYQWDVVYYPESGTFSGTAVGHALGALEGTVAGGGPIFTNGLNFQDLSVGLRAGSSTGPAYTKYMTAVPQGNFHVIFPVIVDGKTTHIGFTAPGNTCILDSTAV